MEEQSFGCLVVLLAGGRQPYACRPACLPARPPACRIPTCLTQHVPRVCSENMFSFSVEKAEFGLKPMNCPGVLLATQTPAALLPIASRPAGWQ